MKKDTLLILAMIVALISGILDYVENRVSTTITENACGKYSLVWSEDSVAEVHYKNESGSGKYKVYIGHNWGVVIENNNTPFSSTPLTFNIESILVHTKTLDDSTFSLFHRYGTWGPTQMCLHR